MNQLINKKAFIIILFLGGVFYFSGLNKLFPMSEDSAIYINLAESLSKGLGYTCTVAPVPMDGNSYPFVYPLMLSPFQLLFPGNYLILKEVSILFTLLSLIVIFFIFKEVYKTEISLLVIPLLVFNAQIFYYSRQILSEIPYLFFSGLTIFYFFRCEGKKSFANLDFLILMFLSYLAFNTRTIGMAVFVAISLYYLWKKEFKKLIVYSVFSILVLILWFFSNSRTGETPVYFKEFRTLTAGLWSFGYRWIYNLCATIGKELPDLYFYPWLVNIDPYEKMFVLKFSVGLILALIITGGFVDKIKKDGLNLIDIYVIIYFFCIYLSWTHHGARYLVPILPFMLYYLFYGIRNIVKKENIYLSIFFLILILNIGGIIKEIKNERRVFYSDTEKSFISAIDWMKDNIASKNTVLSRRPNWIYVYAGGYHGLKLLRTKDTKQQFEYVINNNVNYVIIDQNKMYRDDARDYLFPLIQKYKESFERVYTSETDPKTCIYKVIHK